MSHWHLATLNWIQTLPEDILHKLRAESELTEYRAGQKIFEPEIQPDYVYLLESGRVRLYRHSSQGGEFTYSYVEPGFIFGELPIMEGIERRNYAEAVALSNVIRIPKASFLYSMHHSIEFSNEISMQLAKRLTKAKVNIEDLVFKDARSRVARKLMELASQGDILYTRGEIAKMTGISRPTASIVMGEFEDEGLIAKEGKALKIKEPVKMMDIAIKDVR